MIIKTSDSSNWRPSEYSQLPQHSQQLLSIHSGPKSFLVAPKHLQWTKVIRSGPNSSHSIRRSFAVVSCCKVTPISVQVKYGCLVLLNVIVCAVAWNCIIVLEGDKYIMHFTPVIEIHYPSIILIKYLQYPLLAASVLLPLKFCDGTRQ